MELGKFEGVLVGRKKKKEVWYHMWIANGKFHSRESDDTINFEEDFDPELASEFARGLKDDVISYAKEKEYPTWIIESKHPNYIVRRAVDICNGLYYSDMVKVLADSYLKSIEQAIYFLDDSNYLCSKKVFKNQDGTIDEWRDLEKIFYHTEIKHRCIGGKVRGHVFDICDIYLSFSIDMDTESIKKAITEYRKNLYGMIYTKVAVYLREKRFDIPVKYLQITRITITKSHQVYITMEVKG